MTNKSQVLEAGSLDAVDVQSDSEYPPSEPTLADTGELPPLAMLTGALVFGLIAEAYVVAGPVDTMAIPASVVIFTVSAIVGMAGYRVSGGVTGRQAHHARIAVVVASLAAWLTAILTPLWQIRHNLNADRELASAYRIVEMMATTPQYGRALVTFFAIGLVVAVIATVRVPVLENSGQLR